MVLEDIITVRVNRSLIWIAKSFVDVGFAKDLSDFIRKAVSEQIGEDLYSHDTGEFTKVLREELPKYTTKYAEESDMLPLRVSKRTLELIDLFVSEGVSKNRSEYIRRSIANKCARDRKKMFEPVSEVNQELYSEERIRRICKDEIHAYHTAAEGYF